MQPFARRLRCEVFRADCDEGVPRYVVRHVLVVADKSEEGQRDSAKFCAVVHGFVSGI